MMVNPDNTTAIILAGGKGRRMNHQDKGLISWRDQPLIQSVIEAIKPQLNKIVINANQHIDQYQQFGYPVVDDIDHLYQGPLAGIAAVMTKFPDEYYLVIPCDCPTPPENLFAELSKSIENHHSDGVIANDGHRDQPLFGLYQRTLLPALNNALSHDLLKVMDFIENHHITKADFSDQADAFKNFNRPEDVCS